MEYCWPTSNGFIFIVLPFATLDSMLGVGGGRTPNELGVLGISSSLPSEPNSFPANSLLGGLLGIGNGLASIISAEGGVNLFALSFLGSNGTLIACLNGSPEWVSAFGGTGAHGLLSNGFGLFLVLA